MCGCRLTALKVTRLLERLRLQLAIALLLPCFSRLGSGSYPIPLCLRLFVFCRHCICVLRYHFFQRLYGRCVELVSKPGTNRDGVSQLLQSLPRANLCTLKALALFLRELSESSSVTLMGLDNFAIVFAPCWLRNPSDDPATLLVNANKEIAFAKEALALLCSEEFVVA